MHKIINKLALSLVLLSGVTLEVLAEGTAPAMPATGAVPGMAAAPARPSMFETLMPFLMMFGVMYFLILRPQQKKMKEQQAMLSALAEGDSVVTQSGILGIVRGLEPKVVRIEVANNVQLKVLRSQIAQKLKNGFQEL